MDYKKFIDSVVGNIARKIEDEFNEKDHPRDKGGKFTTKGGEGKGGAKDPIPETETEKAAKEEIGESSKSSSKKLVKNLKEVASEGFYHYPDMIEGFLKDMGVKMPKLSSEEQEYFEEYPDEYRDLLMDKVNAAIERDPEKAHEALGEWASDISEEDEEVKAGKETDKIVEEFKGSGIDMYAALADLGIDVQHTPEAYHEDVFKEKLFNSPKFRQKAKEYIKQYRGTEDEEEWFK